MGESSQSNGNKDSETEHGHVIDIGARPSINVRLIRHAESRNNQVYRDARFLFKGGTPEFDKNGWIQYVNTHRSHDPTLSDIGMKQREKLADLLVPHLVHQASSPVQVIISPMRRTLETIKPTLDRLKEIEGQEAKVLVNGFYHESEGCHIKDKALEGMTSDEIRSLMNVDDKDDSSFQFVGFPEDESRGWYAHGTKAETRAESEERAAKFYLWFCEYLDQQLNEARGNIIPDVFDAGVTAPGEEHEADYSMVTQRKRKRRMTLCVGHGDFMSLFLKRVVAGFGHSVEFAGNSHRSAFVHYNTGMTELEYFGQGRFMVMCQNVTPHFSPEDYMELRGGGSLKDGWSYVMPTDHVIDDGEVVAIHFDDEEVEEHIKEQAAALKSLYLGSGNGQAGTNASRLIAASGFSVEDDDDAEGQENQSNTANGKKVSFFVKRGLQVVGCATYHEETGRLSEVVVRPSSSNQGVGDALVQAVQSHARKVGRSGSLYVQPTNEATKDFLQRLGFEESSTKEGDDVHTLEL